MRVTQLTIRNILGIEEFNIKPGKFTRIEGGNGIGKSSIVEAIKSVIQGGQDASLLRNGATEGEIVLLLEGDPDVAKIRETVGENRRIDRQVFNAKGTKLPSPRTRIDELFDAMSANPVAFLSAGREERARVLLETLPLTVPVEDIERIAGRSFPESMTTGHALEVLDRVETAIFDERTAQTVLSRQCHDTAKRLRASLPPDSDEDYAALLEAERAKMTAIEVEEGKFASHCAAVVEELKGQFSVELGEKIEAYQSAIADHDAEILRLEKLLSDQRAHKVALNTLIAEEKVEMRRKVEEATAEAAATMAAKRGELGVRRAEVRAEAARLQELVAQISRAASARDLIRESESEAGVADAKHAALTERLNEIETYRRGLMDQLPIPGLSVKDGKIFIDDIEFDRLNKARQVQVALKVAKKRAGKLGLVLMDNAECLDPETFEAFEQAVLESGDELQFIVTRVTSGEMKVTAREVVA